jgi:dipeptidyl aminopeptidase/acylaminoacyl peptidase
MFILVAFGGMAAKALAERQEIPSSVVGEQVQLDAAHRIWIFRPKKVAGRRPVVLIAPAGSPLFYGMSLGRGDMPEELPYAEAGCIVVAYDVSGPQPNAPGDREAEIQAFAGSKMGVLDAKRALTYVLKKYPSADPSKVVSVGHSPAATISLEVAAADPRVHACIAYAPVVDVSAHLSRTLPALERAVPGFRAVLNQVNPANPGNRLSKPLFLFHSDEDTVVPAGPIRKLAASTPGAKLVEVSSGDHYRSMIEQGIPDGVAWLRTIGYLPKA